MNALLAGDRVVLSFLGKRSLPGRAAVGFCRTAWQVGIWLVGVWLGSGSLGSGSLAGHGFAAAGAAELAGFRRVGPFDEQVSWRWLPNGTRLCVVAPASLVRPARTLVIYATPNGNTIEETLGCTPAAGRSFRYDIQHVAAQWRRARELLADTDLLLAVVEAPQLSWPAFRSQRRGAADEIYAGVNSLADELGCDQLVLAGHSGGGSFLLAYVSAAPTLPARLQRIIFLDANYAYSDDERHGTKLLEWLRGAAQRRLLVLAYDDREVTLNGRPIVGPQGGTYRATQRMVTSFRRELELPESAVGEFLHWTGWGGQIELYVHRNPDRRILHTALVGDMNGLLFGLTRGSHHPDTDRPLGGPRAYASWIQPDPWPDPTRRTAQRATEVVPRQLDLPPRPAGAVGGAEFLQIIRELPRADREQRILQEILRGNVPDFLRRLVPVQVTASDRGGQPHTLVFQATPDYLAVGSDDDFFRLPLNPHTAQQITQATRTSLPTTVLVDDLFTASSLRATPQPLVQERDAPATFYRHQQLIEEQLGQQQLGQRDRSTLVVGIKKDVVLTRRLRERPDRVAIYGWHQPNGRPIQPLYTGHVDWYVDYSHGVRLIAAEVQVDGRPIELAQLLTDPDLFPLVTDEPP
ncbi:MAG: alpha/beta hydrolase [Pirellulales bacterium]